MAELVAILLLNVKLLPIFVIVVHVIIVLVEERVIIIVVIDTVQIWSLHQIFIIVTCILHRIVLGQFEIFDSLVDLIVIKRCLNIEDSSTLTRLHLDSVDF